MLAPAVMTGDTDTKARLGKLAPELHIKIAEYLNQKDIKAARLSCRALAKDTNDVFAQKCFSTIACVCDRDRLTKLHELSASPFYARHVEELEFREGSCENVQDLLDLRHLLIGTFQNLAKVDKGHNIVLACNRSRHDHTAAVVTMVHLALVQSEHAVYRLKVTSFGINSSPRALDYITDQESDQVLAFWSKLPSVHVVLDGPARLDSAENLLANANETKSLTLVSPRIQRIPIDFGPSRLIHLSIGTNEGRIINHLIAKCFLELLERSRHSLRELEMHYFSLYPMNDTTTTWTSAFQWMRSNLNLHSLVVHRVSLFHRAAFFLDGTFIDFEMRNDREAVKEKLSDLSERGYLNLGPAH